MAGLTARVMSVIMADGMARFSLPQDPVFQQLNASLAFDWRLGPYDVAQSRAHVKMLARGGDHLAPPTATSC